MKRLLALLPLLLLGACADYGYSPGAWAGYDGTYDWGYSGYQRPVGPGDFDGPVYQYQAPAYYPQAYAYPAPSYGPPAYGPQSYGPPGGHGGYAPDYYGSYYEGPGYGPY
jgi:hypothetical protein